MKKILLASTALAFSAGMASAQVAISGYGFMGIVNNSGSAASAGWAAANDAVIAAEAALADAATAAARTAAAATLATARTALAAETAAIAAGTTLAHGARLNFTASVQADHGVAFTMFSRNSISAGGAWANDRLRLDVAANGLTLSVGNTNGAIRSLARTFAYYGFNDGGIFGGDTGNVGQADSGQNVYARYTFDAFTLGVSTTTAGGDVEVGARYSASGITVGAAISSGAGNPYAIHAAYNGGDWTVQAGYNSTQRLLVSGSYTFDAITVGAAVQTQGGATTYGLDVGYNLGGGATLSATVGVAGGNTRIGAGAFFSF
jgi:outer membrane protein OmpU